MSVGLRRHLGLPLALALLASAGVASAQTNKSNDASNPAVNTANTADDSHFVASSALQKGANSFTEGEVRSRLESAGLKDVTDLKKDDAGVWRGKAKRNDKSVSVGVDYKGEMAAE